MMSNAVKPDSISKQLKNLLLNTRRRRVKPKSSSLHERSPPTGSIWSSAKPIYSVDEGKGEAKDNKETDTKRDTTCLCVCL